MPTPVPYRLLVILAFLVTLPGCASIVDGVSQPVRVETRSGNEAVVGAECRLTSNKGTWFIVTPSNLTVHRGFQDLAILCTKTGMMPADVLVASHVKGMAFGNLLFGGAIGVIVDSGNGSAFDYPDLITIEMQRAEAGYVPSPPTQVTKAPTTNYEVPTIAMAQRAPEQPKHELRYQVAAERFVRTTTCTASGAAILNTYGAGFETYTVPCTSGVPLLVRCEFGECHIIR